MRCIKPGREEFMKHVRIRRGFLLLAALVALTVIGAGSGTANTRAFTTPSDSSAPVITKVQVVNITNKSALVTWTTNKPATGRVCYGLTKNYDLTTSENIALSLTHLITLNDLSPNSLYHFCVKSVDSSGHMGISGDNTFATKCGGIEIIVDNLDADSSGFWYETTMSGGWPEKDSDFEYTPSSQSLANATFTWTPTITTPGHYDVYCWYYASSACTTRAKYTTYYLGGSVTATINQRKNGSQWVKIASGRMFNAGTAGKVTLNNLTNEVSLRTYIIADAIRFVYVDTETIRPSVPTNLKAVAESSSQISLTWDASTDNTGVAGYKIYRNGSVIGITDTTSYSDMDLSTNTRYSYTVSAFDMFDNESAQSAPAVRYTLGIPLTPASITCNRSAGIWYNTGTFQFTNINLNSDPAGTYRYIWDTSTTHTWTNNETLWTTANITTTAIPNASGWYLHVKSYNAEKIESGSVDLGPYYCDNKPPTVTSITVPRYIKRTATSLDYLTAQWTGTDAESGIALYAYAIGTSPGATDIVNWVSADAGTSAMCYYAGALDHDYTYYWSVKAKDQAGNWSAPIVSQGSIYVTVYTSLAKAMNNPDYTPVIIDTPVVVTANFGDYTYVQDSSRSRGLRVSFTSPWSVGDQVTLMGRMNTISGERELSDVECLSHTYAVSSPAPINMSIAMLGGGLPDKYTGSVINSSGIYTLGLLVKTTGKVISHGTGWFIITDGSKAVVKVYSNATVTDNTDFVGVTGIATIESGQRVIKTRTAQDVVNYNAEY